MQQACTSRGRRRSTRRKPRRGPHKQFHQGLTYWWWSRKYKV